MKLALRDHAAHLASQVSQFKMRELSFDTLAGLPARSISSARIAAPADLTRSDLCFFFRYDIFPTRILRFFGEWQLHAREMREGDVIVQQAQLPPAFGIFLIFAVRVLSIERTPSRAAFSYGTLQGHPESGVNEFSFTREHESVTAAVHTRAGAGLPLTTLLAPIFTFPYASYCNRQALRCMTRKFEEANSPHPVTSLTA